MVQPEPPKRLPLWRAGFEITAALVMIGLTAAIVWQGRGRRSGSAVGEPASLNLAIPTEPIQIGTGNTRGRLSATVAIVEYADFECPFCAKFSRTIKSVLFRDYVDSGRVVFVFKNFALPSHRRAPAAARAAWCAAQQDKFWEMHDRLFDVPSKFEDFDLEEAAKVVGLDSARYNSCRAGDEARQHVETERADAERLEIPATPAFFIGRVGSDGRVQVSDALLGANSVEAFKMILDKRLSEQAAGTFIKRPTSWGGYRTCAGNSCQASPLRRIETTTLG